MQCSFQLQGSSKLAIRSHRQQVRLQRLGRVQSQSGRTEPFNEGAVQVKRLVDRDRKQLLGNEIDILDKFETEFGDPSEEPALTKATVAASTATAAASSSGSGSSSSSSSSDTPTSSSGSSSTATATAAKPAAPAAVQTKFTGSGSLASPFGAPSRTRSMMEPKGLAPDMSPDPIIKQAPTPANLLSKITLTQVVLFCTFSSMIVLMLATFSVVVNSGAVRLAGIE